MDGASAEMPKYKCYKEVWALKIAQIERQENGSIDITPEDTRYSRINLSSEYASKHQPEEGGYYVVYKDGYKSFSPAEAFESGYELIK